MDESDGGMLFNERDIIKAGLLVYALPMRRQSIVSWAGWVTPSSWASVIVPCLRDHASDQPSDQPNDHPNQQPEHHTQRIGGITL
jgi:hypothetical protein